MRHCGQKKDSEYARVAWTSVYPVPSHAKEIFKITKDDIFIAIFSAITTIAVWYSFRRYSHFSNMYSYWDASDAYFSFTVNKKRSLLSSNDPFLKYYRKSYREFINPLPVPKIVFRIFYTISFGHPHLAQLLYTLSLSVFSSLVFRRVCIVYDLVKSPTFTTVLFSFFPLRFVFYRCLPTYDTLFLTLILLAFLFYRTGLHIPLMVTIFVASFTKIEGAALFIVFFICYAISTNFMNLVSILVLGSIVYLIMILKFPTITNFIIPYASMDNQNPAFFKMKPFHYYLSIKDSISNLRYIHAVEMAWFPGIFGGFLLMFQSLPLSIFCFVYSIFLSCLKTSDMHRFAIPAHVISILIGCDFFLSHPMLKFVLICVIPVFFYGELYYCGNQVRMKQIPYEIINFFGN